VIIGEHLSCQLHCEEQVFLPLTPFLSQCSHHAIHVIDHVIVHCQNVMQCDCVSLRHPQDPISEWPQHFHDNLYNGPIIVCCEEWPLIAECWVFQLLMCEFA